MKITKNLKENKNVRKELLNSSLKVSQSVSAVTIQGMPEKCSDSKFKYYMTFQINDNHDSKIISFKQILVGPINLLVKLESPVRLNFTLTLRVNLRPSLLRLVPKVFIDISRLPAWAFQIPIRNKRLRKSQKF